MAGRVYSASNGASGGTSRYWSAKRAIAWKAGAATTPPQIARRGSSTVTSTTSLGFVPASAPRLVIAVAVDEPRTTIWGGVVAAPVFQQIARFALQYLEVPPDAPVG